MFFFRIRQILLGVLLVFSVATIPATDIEYPLIQSLAHFPFLNHQPLPKNIHTITLNLKYSNIFMFDQDLTSFNDMETISLTGAFRYGFTPSITLELYLHFSLAYGGIMDGLIDTFHQIFGISPGGRDLYPQNTLNYRYKDYFFYEKSQPVISAPIIAVLTPIATGKNLSLSARIGLQLPLFAKRGFNSGQMTLLAGLISKWQKDDLIVEFSNHTALFQKPNWLNHTSISQLIWHSEILVRYKKYLTGIILRTSPFKTRELSNNACQIYAGIKITSDIEFLFIEEIPPLDTTPDFTFCFRFYFN